METSFPVNNHKVLIGFKCSPTLRSILCTQADKLGITLSSYVETLVLTQEDTLRQIELLSGQIKSLDETIADLKTSLQKSKEQLVKDREIVQKTTGRFILDMTKGHKEKAIQLIQIYNTILNNERQNNS